MWCMIRQIVTPTDVWVMARGNEAIVTLITCYPYQVDSKRIVVFAKLRDERVVLAGESI